MKLKLTVVPLRVLEHIRNSCGSFFKKNFNTNSLILAIFFSLPIYINYFIIEYDIKMSFFIKILFTAVMFIALFYLFHKKHNSFLSGFLIGLLWFWWVGLSFRYYGMGYMFLPVAVFISTVYGTLFYSVFKLADMIKNVYLKKIYLLVFFTIILDHVSIFTFDWLKLGVLFVNTIFTPFNLVVFSVAAAVVFYRELKYLSLAILVFCLFFKPAKTAPLKLDVFVASTYVAQDKKWLKSYIPLEIKHNFQIINRAISEKKDVVILPESAFALFLNIHKDLVEKLKELSKKITIITGALHLNRKYYNSTYIFENGNMKILDKHVLVPFGEYIPFPFFEKEINDFFFAGASDYSTSGDFGEFEIKNHRFLNAICYEATVEKLYYKPPKYIIALSNVAWFMPSTMPSLQQMLIKLYAIKHSKTVYHSINGFKSYIIKPDF